MTPLEILEAEVERTGSLYQEAIKARGRARVEHGRGSLSAGAMEHAVRIARENFDRAIRELDAHEGG